MTLECPGGKPGENSGESNSLENPEQKTNILFIDDEPMLIKIYLRSFQKRFGKVFGTISPEEGQEYIMKKQGPLIVVSDMEMHPLSGPEIAQNTLQHRQIHRIPLIINTGAYEREIDNLERLRQRGVIDSYHSKPIDVPKLGSILSQISHQLHHQTSRHR